MLICFLKGNSYFFSWGFGDLKFNEAIQPSICKFFLFIIVFCRLSLMYMAVYLFIRLSLLLSTCKYIRNMQIIQKIIKVEWYIQRLWNYYLCVFPTPCSFISNEILSRFALQTMLHTIFVSLWALLMAVGNEHFKSYRLFRKLLLKYLEHLWYHQQFIITYFPVSCMLASTWNFEST